MSREGARRRPTAEPWEDCRGVAVSAYQGLAWTPRKELIHVAIGGPVDGVWDGEPLTRTACGRGINGSLLPDSPRPDIIEWSVCRTCLKRVDARQVWSTVPSDEDYESAPLLGTWVAALWLDTWLAL